MKLYYPELMGSDALGWIDGRKRSRTSIEQAIWDDVHTRLRKLGKHTQVTRAYVGPDRARIESLEQGRPYKWVRFVA
jgi:hypothetical protein